MGVGGETASNQWNTKRQGGFHCMHAGLGTAARKTHYYCPAGKLCDTFGYGKKHLLPPRDCMAAAHMLHVMESGMLMLPLILPPDASDRMEQRSVICC